MKKTAPTSSPLTVLRHCLLAVALPLLCISNLITAVAAQPAATFVTMNMRDADIRALIQWIAEQTHKQIVIDPRVQGRVSIFADHPVTTEQAYQIFLATLQTQGYAATETNGVLKIFPQALAKTGPRTVIEATDNTQNQGQVIHVVTLQNVVSGSLAEIIRPLLSQTGYIAPLPASNSLLIADERSIVDQLTALSNRLDREGNLDIDIVRLQHANARDLAQVLMPLSKSTGANTAPLSIAADERSNTLLLAGDPASRQRTKQLVRQLDQPISTTGFTRVVFLNYLTAEELIPVLKSTSNAQQKDSKDNSIQQGSVSIEASKSTNALVLTGPPDLLDNMQEAIAKLDVRRSQVLVQAIIVELTSELTNKLGVEWNTGFSGTGGQAATNFGLAPSTAAVALATAGGGSALSLLSSGLTLGYYKGGDLRALISALATDSNANLLSTPSVMTLDNQQAEIIVGSNIPIITGQSTNTSGTTNPFTTYERKDIGVTLKLTPQINGDRAITLDIEQDLESVINTLSDPSLTNSKDVVTNKRSISTKVIVDNNDILVLGGLISDEDQQQISKVPVLGDLPLVGRLFRSTSSQKVKRNLMVFIHPVIVKDGEPATEISRAGYEAMQTQMQVQQSTPPHDPDRSNIKALPDFETFRPAIPLQK